MIGPIGAGCLRRARGLVINVMIAASAGIAISGVILRNCERGALQLPRDRTRQLAQLLLFALALASIWLRVHVPRREGDSAPALANRFIAFRLASSVSAALAVPLGLAYSWAVEPDLTVVAPFWAVALGLNVLAIPRTSQVESLGLDGPEA